MIFYLPMPFVSVDRLNMHFLFAHFLTPTIMIRLWILMSFNCIIIVIPLPPHHLYPSMYNLFIVYERKLFFRMNYLLAVIFWQEIINLILSFTWEWYSIKLNSLWLIAIWWNCKCWKCYTGNYWSLSGWVSFLFCFIFKQNKYG